MDESIERLAHKIGGSFELRSKRFARAAKWTKWVLVVCSAGATAAHFFAGEPWTAAAHVGIGLSGFIFVSGALLLFLDEDASEELEAARKTIEEARAVQDKANKILDGFSEYEAQLARSNELYLAMHKMRETIEKSITIGEEDMQHVAQSILETSGRSLTVACGFELDEHYTICIYEARTDTSQQRTRLHCIAQVRSTACDLVSARIWDSGNSVVGICHSSGREVLIPDMLDMAVSTGFRVSNPKPDDDKLYRSMAAVPIRGDRGALPWGVAIASSSNAGLFSTAEDGGVQPAEAVRALAGMMELALRSRTKIRVLAAAKNAFEETSQVDGIQEGT